MNGHNSPEFLAYIIYLPVNKTVSRGQLRFIHNAKICLLQPSWYIWGLNWHWPCRLHVRIQLEPQNLSTGFDGYASPAKFNFRFSEEEQSSSWSQLVRMLRSRTLKPRWPLMGDAYQLWNHHDGNPWSQTAGTSVISALSLKLSLYPLGALLIQSYTEPHWPTTWRHKTTPPLSNHAARFRPGLTYLSPHLPLFLNMPWFLTTRLRICISKTKNCTSI